MKILQLLHLIFKQPEHFHGSKENTHLLTSMQKSPLMVPGLDSAGLVSPSITLPVFTTPLPSHTWNTQTQGMMGDEASRTSQYNYTYS